MNGKHEPPVRCRIRQAMVTPSPSALAYCNLGLRRRCPKCEGCTENTAEAIYESFMAGLSWDPRQEAVREQDTKKGNNIVLGSATVFIKED